MAEGGEKSKIKLNVIFVCTGNTCRSPMAEFLFKDYLREKKRTGDFNVTSAGLEAGKGDVMTRQADEALTALGVKHNPDRKARVFTVQMSMDGDLIIGMTDEHAARTGSDNATSFAELTGRPVADPFGMSVNTYLQCAEQIRAAFDKILEIADELLKNKRASAG
ncbi:MAG: hypothetical protein K2L54_04090 [Clostridiales bacterium]|nr:hypothetical protein [Clostridiales bacterium]